MSGTQPRSCQSVKMLADVFLNNAFPAKIVLGHGPELVLLSLAFVFGRIHWMQ